MSALCFDTLAFANRLKAAGVGQAQAEALGEVVDHNFGALATKDNLRHFPTKDDLRNFATRDDLRHFATKDELHAEIGRLNVRFDALEARVDKLETELAALKALLAASLTQLEQRLLIKFGAMLSAAIVLLAALTRLGI